VRAGQIRVEWQLYEMDNGQFHRCPPKDESRRPVIAPDWLITLLTEHVSRTRPGLCPCHGFRYVFNGHRAINRAAQQPGPKLIDVARRAEVGIGTASAVLNGRAVVTEATRARVLAAIEELGYVRSRARRRPRAALAAQRLRDLGVPARGDRRLPVQGTPSGPAGAGAGRPLARRAAARP
jgi:Bacterial regulatory proteins, lacI family